MLIPPAAWEAASAAGLTLTPSGDPQRVSVSMADTVLADKSGRPHYMQVKRSSVPLSPKHVRATATRLAAHRQQQPDTATWLLVVPAASPHALDLARAEGISVIVVDDEHPEQITGQIVLPFGTVQLATPNVRSIRVAPRPRPGRPPWGSLAVVRRLLTYGVASQPELVGSIQLSQGRVSQILSELIANGLSVRVRKEKQFFWIPQDWDTLADWWLDKYPGAGGLTTYWYGFDSVHEQARVVAKALMGSEIRAAISGDVAADRLAPWRRAQRAVLYAGSDDRVAPLLQHMGLTPSGPDEATLELSHPTDPFVWDDTGTSAYFGLQHRDADVPLADATQVLWDVKRSTGSDVDQAVDVLRRKLRERSHRRADERL